MNQEKGTIDLDWLTRPTGDPFTDVGGYVIQILQEKFPDKDIWWIIEFITEIYVKDWNGGLHSFFLNSTITQPAFDKPRKIKETISYFNSLLEKKEKFITGVCRLTGNETELFPAGRSNSIMSGSGTFINFHHSFEDGIYISKEMIIRYFFIPFGVQYLSDKLSIIHSNSQEITKLFVSENVKLNLANKSMNSSEGILKSEFHNPANSIFEFANQCINKTSDIENISLSMYHFTNFGAKPDIDLYTFPSNLYTFYKNCLNPSIKEDWLNFIRSHYTNSKLKNITYNQKNQSIQCENKNKQELVNYDTYKSWNNIIYNKLLYNESILKNILKWSEKNKFDFRITTYYQVYLRNMNRKTIQKIEEISDFIIQKKDKDQIKKSITRLNSLRKSYELRSYLLSLIKENFNNGNEKPLITLQEYVEYLFPDGTIWSEIRDLLIISIYQKLHENGIKLEIELPELENEEENEGELL